MQNHIKMFAAGTAVLLAMTSIASAQTQRRVLPQDRATTQSTDKPGSATTGTGVGASTSGASNAGGTGASSGSSNSGSGAGSAGAGSGGSGGASGGGSAR